MKKIVFLAFLLVSGVSFIHAQQGSFMVNAGTSYNNLSGIPIYGGVEYYIQDEISVGAELSYQVLDDYDGINEEFNVLGYGIMGNYHFGDLLELSENLDIYAGAGLSYYHFKYDNNSNYSVNSHQVNLGGQAGIRYYFIPNLAVNGQVGGGNNITGARVGLTLKF